MNPRVSGIWIIAFLILLAAFWDDANSQTHAPRHESSDQALARPSTQPVTDPFRRDESLSADQSQPQQMLIAEPVDHGKKTRSEEAPRAEEAPQVNEKQQAEKKQLGKRELERERPEVLPRKYRRPSDETLQTIEYFLDRKSGLKVVRGWGIEARLRSDEGHSQDLVAFRVIGPGCEDGRFIGVCTLKPCSPVSGAATAFMESLPNRYWNAADKAAQRLVELAEALRDGKVVLHED